MARISLACGSDAAFIDLTNGSITAAIDRLERGHLVARADQTTDRRAVIHLTPAGKGVIAKVFAGHEDAMEKAMSGLSRTDRATLTDLLKRPGTTAEANSRKKKE